MKSRGSWIFLWLASVTCSHAATSSEVATNTESIVVCVQNKFSRQAEESEFTGSSWTALTELYIASRITEYAASCSESCLDTQALCSVVYADYLNASDAAQQARNERAKNQLAPAGTLELEFERSFVERGNNQWFTHLVGHADITFAALTESEALGVLKDSPAGALIARGSQAPDLYAWYDDASHAQTPPYDELKSGARKQAIADGIRAYQKLLAQRIDQAVKYVNANARASALFAIGLAAHQVQDLIYHMGITLQQHSGLSYVLWKNPDYPDGWLRPDEFTRAKHMTMRLLRTVRARLTTEQCEALAAWSPNATFATKDVAQEFFPMNQDNSVGALVEYFLMASRYRGRENELVFPAICEKGPGLACWNLEEIVRGYLDD